ncbi:EamA family transporter [Cupriavidus necator]|uniref:GntR family transcriptional regulator n=1 Tax=Cupriavidus necator TaxID=106590 RepID=A0A367PJC7_CUPNE|nr:EamA family transporter [Cupriavidus necator]QQX86424.1 EamA family transporter [Cupriavidus necator]RCJ07634.1 GntR family transcriptional regulator [Cupriavidus necator]
MPPLVLLCLLITYVVWGTTYLAIRFTLESFPPLFMMGTRFLCAGLLLAAWLAWRGTPMPSWRLLRNCAVPALFLLVGGMGLTAIAEQTISSGATTVMIGSMPIFALIWSACFGNRPKWYEYVAIAIGSLGILVLTAGAEFRVSTGGVVALMLAVASWSFGSQLARRLELPQGAAAFAAEMLIGGAVLMVLSALRQEPWPASVSTQAGWAWVYLVVAGSLVAFSAYMYLVSTVSQTLSASYVYVNPPVALAMGAWLGGEQIAPQTLGAVMLILVALAVLSLGTLRTARAQAA